jgi:hypothetical protein
MVSSTGLGAAAYAMAEQNAAQGMANAQMAGMAAGFGELRRELESNKAGLKEVLHISRARNATYELMLTALLRKIKDGQFDRRSNQDVVQFIQQSSNLIFPSIVIDSKVIKQTYPDGVIDYEHKNCELYSLNQKRLKGLTNTEWVGAAKYPGIREQNDGFSQPSPPIDKIDNKAIKEGAESIRRQLKSDGMERVLSLKGFPNLTRDEYMHPEDVELIPVLLSAREKDLLSQIPALEAAAASKSKNGFFSKALKGDGGDELKKIEEIKLELNDPTPAAIATFNANLPAYIDAVHRCNDNIDASHADFKSRVANFELDRKKEEDFAKEMLALYNATP